MQKRAVHHHFITLLVSVALTMTVAHAMDQLVKPLEDVKIVKQLEGIQLVQLFKEDSESDNFVVRWDFRRICDHVYDPEYLDNPEFGQKAFDSSAIKPGDIIFLRGIRAPEFFERIAPLIKVPYSIVSHGEFRDGFQEAYLPYLDSPNLIGWWGVHPCEKSHPKFHPIPLGVYSPRTLKELADQKTNPDEFCKKIHKDFNDLYVSARNKPKKFLAYSNFTNATHPERGKVADLFNKQPWCRTDERVDPKTYLEHMGECLFTFSPRGEGIDCYRNYEAMLLGTIPILIDCQLKELFEGQPVLFVDGWEKITEEFLIEAYEKISKQQYSLKKLYSEHYFDEIKAAQKAVREAFRAELD